MSTFEPETSGRPFNNKRSFKAGLGGFLLFLSKFGLKQPLVSCYVTRYCEYPFALKIAGLKPGDRVLDFGCGSSLFPAYLSYRGAEVFCLDIKHSTVSGLYRFLSSDRSKSVLQGELPHYVLYGGSEIPFKDGVFDRIFAVSTLEHLRGEKDIAAAAQFKRLLKPGGTAFISVEFHNRYKEFYLDCGIRSADSRKLKSDFIGFTRYYNRQAVFERIIKPSGLRLSKEAYFGSPWINVRKYVDTAKYMGLASIFAGFFYRELRNTGDFERCRQAPPPYLSNIVACLALKKAESKAAQRKAQK